MITTAELDAAHNFDATTLQYLHKQALDLLLARDPEGWSCLQGLFAMLRLPATDEGRQHLEIDRGGDLGWMQVDQIVVNLDAIAYTKGHNGHSEVFTVSTGSPVPRWRVKPGPKMYQPQYI